jgi:hypothetical protein
LIEFFKKNERGEKELLGWIGHRLFREGDGSFNEGDWFKSILRIGKIYDMELLDS